MRAGAALPAVLFTIAMTSAMAVGGAYVARQQAGYARLSLRAALVQPAAEEALVMAIAGWDSVVRSEQAIGTSASLPTTALPSVISEVWITRTGADWYWVVAESRTIQGPPLRRRLGVLLRATGGPPGLAPIRPWTELH